MAHYEARRLIMSSAALLHDFKRAASNETMTTVAEIRLSNLERLVAEFGTLDAVAALAETSSIYLSQIRNRAKDAKTLRPREMGSAMARRLEVGAKKPAGWMDVAHEDDPNASDSAALTQLSCTPDEATLLAAFRALAGDAVATARALAYVEGLAATASDSLGGAHTPATSQSPMPKQAA